MSRWVIYFGNRATFASRHWWFLPSQFRTVFLLLFHLYVIDLSSWNFIDRFSSFYRAYAHLLHHIWNFLFRLDYISWEGNVSWRIKIKIEGLFKIGITLKSDDRTWDSHLSIFRWELWGILVKKVSWLAHNYILKDDLHGRITVSIDLLNGLLSHFVGYELSKRFTNSHPAFWLTWRRLFYFD